MPEDGRNRIVITIRPQPSDVGLLKVSDALQQVLDFLKVIEAAGDSLTSDPQQKFDWRLESASTNSPLTVVALAQARNSSVDVMPNVIEAKRMAGMAFRAIGQRKTLPQWVNRETRLVITSFYKRNLNGIAETSITLPDAEEDISVTPDTASAGLDAIRLISPFEGQEIPARTSYGEVDGRLIGAGHWRARPVVTILTELYGPVMCLIPPQRISELGGQRTIEDVWQGRRVSVEGRLSFAEGGKLTKIAAVHIRERLSPEIDINTVVDADFTAGLDPVTYLQTLHAGFDA